MSDTIYRQDAINVLEGLSACEEYGVEVGTDEETYIGKYEAITAISDLPSADRPKGEWIEMYRDGFGNMICMCSKCNFHTTKSNFCPNCGADMRDKNDE